MLLAIDTSLGTSVAVVDRDRGILSEVSDPDRNNHAAVIGALIKQALELSETDPHTLSGVAVGTGPGPQRSIDVGLAAAQGFAAARGKPVVRVLSHDSIMLDRDHSSLVITCVSAELVASTAYGEPDIVTGLPTRIGEPRFSRTGGTKEIQEHVKLGQIKVPSISAGALGMLAEHLFAAGQPFARRAPYYPDLA
jgi:tRNA threonylcarbamoyl adenosine modification protein YeaZ